MRKQIVITAQAQEFIMAQPLPVINRFMSLIKVVETDGRLGMPDAKKIMKGLGL